MCPKPTFTQANIDNILDNSAETNKQKGIWWPESVCGPNLLTSLDSLDYNTREIHFCALKVTLLFNFFVMVS